MGVDVDDVEAHVAGPAPAEDRVEVGAVVVDERADIMEHRGDLLDTLLEQAERVGVREHQAGDLIVERAGERVHVDEPSLVGRHAHRLEPGEADAGRVRAVGGVGDERLHKPAAVILVVGAHDQQPGHLSTRARREVEAWREPCR